MHHRKRLDLASLLNREQLEAATTTDGPLLILAGAGSGKTRVLVHRMAHILEIGLARPHEIFAVTFTNKAAGEMRNRLEALIGDSVREAWIGTFHALSARILRMEGHRLGYSSTFTIYDDEDSKRLIKSIMDDLRIDTSHRGASVALVAHEIDRAKNRGLSPAGFADDSTGAATYRSSSPEESHESRQLHDLVRRAFLRVYPRYQDCLRRSNAMDFGDLLMLAVELLGHHPDARRRFSDRFRYVMVDEFQDTNTVQYQLLKLLVETRRNLAVVGDDDQAIYRWRGADVANILDFTREFPEATVVKLERNYRSTRNILEAANAVIRRNRRRHEKTLRTDAPEGAAITVGMVARSEDEAWLVAKIITSRLERGERPEDFAILYRQNAQSRLFEEAFRRLRIPFVLIGGTAFYERREVKDILAYLRLTANPTSRQDFERIANVPARGIGEKTMASLRTAAEPRGLEGAMMLTLSPAELERAGLKATAIAKLKALQRMLESFREVAAEKRATEVARAIIDGTEYIDHLERTEPQTAEERIANVAELVSSIAEYESSFENAPEGVENTAEEGLGLAGARTPLQGYLDTAALMSPSDEESREGAVSMLTLHGAKGLEFRYVFMVGMEELTFPSRRAVEEGGESMEEERRLCYVGITRAMMELHLLAARYRRIYGREEARWASRFLGELPSSVVADIRMPDAGGAFGPADGPEEDDPRSAARNALREVPRGADHIIYDSDAHFPPEGAAGAEGGPDGSWGETHSPLPPRAGNEGRVGPRPGALVFHNTFGEGTVEASEGRGSAARLTIRFPDAGTRVVVAKYVRFIEES